MNIKFENHSVSGIYREYAGFILNIPGHAIGNKAVVAKVPDELATDVRRYLAANHPAIVVTVEGEENVDAAAKEAAEKAEAERLTDEAEAAQKAAKEAEAVAAKEKEEAEKAAAEAAEKDAAAKEAAEKAEASKAKKGGK